MQEKTDIILSDGSPAVLLDTKYAKVLASENYNYMFNKKTGLFMRWGKTQREDGELDLGVPEIADIEISTICSGLGIGCDFCYKSNMPDGEYMSLNTFKTIFHNLPKTVTQIAFGIGNIHANPDMWDIFKYTKDHGMAANVTVNGAGISDAVADKLVEYCDAVAVSLYQKDLTYDAVKKLSDRGLEQTNIHCMIATETFDNAIMLVDDFFVDERLAGLNAVVFLSLKPKGRGEVGYTRMNDETFKKLVDHALEKNIRFGFDSCSAPKFLKSVKDHPNFATFEQSIEPCEAGVYSSYINVKGYYFPCSFLEGVTGWEEGIDTKSGPFMTNVWNADKTLDYKKRTIGCRGCGRACAHYDLENF